MLLDYIIENEDTILDIFERYGATNVTIVGSVARREENDESDIDFVADFKTEDQHDLEAYKDLRKELKQFFGRKIHLTTYDQFNMQYPNALENGVPLNRL